MFFLQMAGFPGSGKSYLARRIATLTDAVVIDHDVVKTALLEGMAEVEIDPRIAGQISYNIDWALVESNLSLGKSVILDSPCLYQIMIEKGEASAEKYHAKYKFVECLLTDFQEINNRLQAREKLISQVGEVKSLDAFQNTIKKGKRPEKYPMLTVDTSEPIDAYFQRVMD